MTRTGFRRGWLGIGDLVERHSPSFTVYQVTIFFTVYVFFQVWNQINCRSLTPNAAA